MAAKQLAEVVRLHPDEADTILQHLHPLIRSKQWETRMAAVDAIEEVMRTDKFSAKGEQAVRKEVEIETTKGLLRLDTFDLESVLQSSGEMGASGGEEFDFTTTSHHPHCEDMQRRELNERLGLDFSTKFGGISADELFASDEVQAQTLPAASTTTAPMSARERNKLKRALTKRKRAISEAASLEAKKSKMLPSRRYLADRSRMDSGIWPLRDFCAILKEDLFDEVWEVRHGAATAIREIVRLQGSHAGATVGMDSTQVAASRSMWLQDMALNLVVVIVKDRFGDFRSDEVVAPVRESSSQALVSCFLFLQILKCY